MDNMWFYGTRVEIISCHWSSVLLHKAETESNLAAVVPFPKKGFIINETDYINLFILFADTHISIYSISDEIGIYMQSLTSHKLVFWDVGDKTW